MRPLKIAIADDEPAIRALLAAWLTKLGHLVVAVADGAELVDVCRTGVYDLAISDVQMPGLDGVTAADVLRREWGVPVILMSGDWSPDRVRAARAVGAIVLRKPVLPLALVAMVEEAGRRAAPAAVTA